MSEFQQSNFTENSERPMSGVSEASMLLQTVAGYPEKPIKAAIARAALRVSNFLKPPMSYGRAEDIWRQEARLIRSEEMDAIRSAAAERRRKQEAGCAAAKELAALYRGVAERLRSVDEDFHRPEIARLESTARELGAADRAGASSVGGLPLASQDGGGE